MSHTSELDSEPPLARSMHTSDEKKLKQMLDSARHRDLWGRSRGGQSDDHPEGHRSFGKMSSLGSLSNAPLGFQSITDWKDAKWLQAVNLNSELVTFVAPDSTYLAEADVPTALAKL